MAECDRHMIEAPVAQLDRVLPSEGRGHRFESCRVRQFSLLTLSRPAAASLRKGRRTTGDGRTPLRTLRVRKGPAQPAPSSSRSAAIDQRQDQAMDVAALAHLLAVKVAAFLPLLLRQRAEPGLQRLAHLL